MFNKVYLSRAQTRAMSIDHPIGDPFGGAAYGELRDPVTAAISAGGSILSGIIGGGAAKSAASTQADAAQAGIDAQTQAKNDQIAALDRALQEQIAAAGGVVTPQIQNAQSYLAQLKDSIYGYGVNVSKVANDVLAGQVDAYNNVYQQQQNWMNPVYQAGMAGQGQLLNYLGLGANTGQAGYGKYANADFTQQDFFNNQDPGYGFRMSEGLKAVERQAASRNGLISGAALKASQRFGQDMASQEYQNAFNRYQTSRSNTLSPLQTLTGQGANAAGQLGQYAQNYGVNIGNAYTNYGNTVTGMFGNQTNMLNSGLDTVARMQNNAYGNAANLTGAAYGTYGSNVAGVYGNYGTNLSNLYGAQGQANASGTVGSANALTGGITNANNSLYQNQLLNYLNPNKSLSGTTYEGWGGSNAASTYANPYEYNMGVKGFTANGAYG